MLIMNECNKNIVQQVTSNTLSNANLNLIIPNKTINVSYENCSLPGCDAYDE